MGHLIKPFGTLKSIFVQKWSALAAEGGAEVKWLDGYSPEITIFCASPSARVTLHSFTHSL